MRKLFGTDGVRGVANRELTPELALMLGRAAGSFFMERCTPSRRPQLLVAWDSRQSSPMLQAALVAGANSVGVDCVIAGVLPTPGVAYLTRTVGYDGGAMVSASHNPVNDNGIKFFSRSGYKLSDDDEDYIEKLVASLIAGDDRLVRPIGEKVGKHTVDPGLAGRYADFLRGVFNLDLRGLKLVIDCAHGAASFIAPELFQRLGADVVVLNAQPDGTNINVRCGSTHPEVVQAAVVRHAADAGLSFDGDADRIIAVDERGRLFDGDHIMAALGLDFLQNNTLRGRTIVATNYSNGGLRRLLESHGGRVIETIAGDRNVLEAMRREGVVLGGEKSGHIILLEHNTTGDGLLVGLALLAAAQKQRVPLSALRDVLQLMPQHMVNVKVTDKRWEDHDNVTEAIRRGKEILGSGGRILVRASGTEPVIRVMAEGTDLATVQRVVGTVADEIAKVLGVEGR